ncbi:unnamed protein product [Pylaiella littoralis]
MAEAKSSSAAAAAAAAAAELDGLLSWFEGHGGSITKLSLEDLGGELNLSLLTGGEAVRKGETVMSIPISLCMTVESATASELGVVLEANPDLMDTPDEVLALHLMAERRKGQGSFWKEYLRTLPDDVDTPLRWLVQGAQEDFCLLEGTMVGLLSGMMYSQVEKDWAEVHLPLVEAHPEVLGGTTFEDYFWAMSSIWSRSFDFLQPGAEGSPSSRRAMVPVINAANHDPSAAGSLSEMMEFQAGKGASSVGAGDGGGAGGEGGRLCVVAGREYAAREQFFILYGRYSNAKLLYSYGFVLSNNPYGGLDYWVRVPPTDAGLQWKQALLDEHPLTAAQAYDFSGTLRAGGWISPALLATVRVAQLTAEERRAAENAFEGKMVSPRNEAASLGALVAGLRRKLIALGGRNTAGDAPFCIITEEESIASLERELERRQRQRRRQRQEERNHHEEEEEEEEEEGEGSIERNRKTAAGGGTDDVKRVDAAADSDSSAAAAAKTTTHLRRRIAAARVRLEEKTVVADAIATLDASLRELQSFAAATAGGGGTAAFKTLDNRY